VKKIISGVLLAGLACAVFATDARVETMGRNSNFFQDETQIHQNAANLGLYDKIMYGSYGTLDPNRWDPETGSSWNPELPYFGAAISLGQKDNSPSKFSVGVTFNRIDSALGYIAKNLDSLGLRMNRDGNILLFAGDRVGGHPQLGSGNSFNSGENLDWKGKIDLMTAYTLDNGTTIGIGAYLAFQQGASRDLIDGWNSVVTSGSNKELQNRFIKGNLGVNTPIGDGVDLEASVAISTLSLRGVARDPLTGGGVSSTDDMFSAAADNDVGIQIDVRMFADAATLNGAFVPHIQANIFNYTNGATGGDEKVVDLNAGVGINLNIDRGFFWAGFGGLYRKTSHAIVAVDNNADYTPGTDYNATGRKVTFGKKDLTGGKVGFGVERNILTDWFIIRVGGQKLLAKESRDGDKQGSKWVETSDADHVALGMGVNIEDRLKVDFTVAQNLPYTFTSLFSSGASPYLATRVSAVFSF